MPDRIPRVLYIDDDEALRHLVAKDLKRAGYRVETAAEGDSGYAMLAAEPFDLVALDHHMPGETGLELLARIVALPEPPIVIFVTGELDGRIAVGALKAGAHDYVIKEVNGQFLPLLRASISNAVETRRTLLLKERAERELRESRDRYAALAEEREVLIAEINHRVANSLQLVSAFLRIQCNAIDSKAAKHALEAAMARVEAVSHVHRQLYKGGTVRAVDLSGYLKKLIADLGQLVEGFDTQKQAMVECDDLETSADRALAIGILVTEMVINSLKHAYPETKSGPVRVGCRRRDGHIQIVVEDDGCGMPEKGGPKSQGLGKQIIRMMAEKLDARMEHDRAHKGTRFIIDVPDEICQPKAKA